MSLPDSKGEGAILGFILGLPFLIGWLSPSLQLSMLLFGRGHNGKMPANRTRIGYLKQRLYNKAVVAKLHTLFIIGFGVFVARLLPLKDVVRSLQVLYCVSSLGTLSICLFIHSRIKALDQSNVKTSKPPNAAGKKTVAKSRANKSSPSFNVVTHDLQQLRKLYIAVVRGFAMVIVLHLYFGKHRTLILQALLPLATVIRSKLFKIYVMHKQALGELQRPWIDGPGTIAMLREQYQQFTKKQDKEDEHKKTE